MRLAPIALLLAATALPATAQEVLSPAQQAEVDARVRAYILENPEVILEALEVLEARRGEAQAEQDAELISQHASALFEDDHSRVFGNPDGDVTIVEFADYRCGYCKAAHPEVARLLESDGDIRLVYKEFPILGEASMFASRVAMAALKLDPEAYDRLNDAMMTFRGDLDETAAIELAVAAGLDEAELRAAMEDPGIAEGIRANYALARALGVEGTPGFVIGDRIVRGFVQLDRMRELVEEARASAG